MLNHFFIPDFKSFEKNKAKIIKLINDGKIGIFPTDTVYGIGIKGSFKEKYSKIYEIKKRPSSKPIPLVFGSLDNFYDFFDKKNISDNTKKIIRKWWPGPVTVIVKTTEDETLAIRFPEHEILCEIINAIGAPLALTSANLSGNKSPVRVDEISSEIIKNIDFIIDTGTTKYQGDSTIVDLNGDIIREGIIKKHEIENILKPPKGAI